MTPEFRLDWFSLGNSGVFLKNKNALMTLGKLPGHGAPDDTTAHYGYLDVVSQKNKSLSALRGSSE
jgi:hypothetical protein